MEISATPHLYYGRRTNYNCEKINEYSLKNGELAPNSGLKFLNEAMLNKDNMNIDLLEGMEPGKQKLVGGGDQTLSKFCEWLMSVNGRGSSLQEALHGERFVAYRGLFLRLALAPFKSKDNYDLGFIVAATKHKGVSFLCEFLTEARTEFEAAERQKPVEGFHDKRIYAGHKFEKFAVSADDEPGMPEEEETAATIEPTTKHIAVFAGKFQSSSAVPPLPILCISKVDCALEDTREFIELKTQYKALGINRGFWQKALNWYVQSFLTGTKEFVVGLHNEFETDRHGNPVKSQLSGRDQCILQRVEKHPLGHLLVWARQNNVDVCLAFLHAFLAKLKAKLDKEPEGTILVAERPTKSLDFTFKTIPIGDEEGQRRWEVLSEEFKEFGWQ